MEKIVCRAYGKINLTLDVLKKRSDGYHEVITLLQGISLFDELHLKKTKGTGISLTCNIPELSTGSENLAYQAAQLLQKNFPQITGLGIHLVKKIPLAAGLGGGSADAATVLWGLNQLYQLHLTEEELKALGSNLGADVPFCIQPLTALGEGKGEIITPCSPCPYLWLVLLNPPLQVATHKVYEYLAQVQIKERPNLTKVLAGLKKGDREQILPFIGNVLEYSTFTLYPTLKKWAVAMAELKAGKVMMAGSGPSLLLFVPDQKAALAWADSLQKPGWRVEAIHTIRERDLQERMVLSE